MEFGTTIINVLVLIALAIPGYLLVRTGKLKSSTIYVLTTILLYVNQPAFTLSSFQAEVYSKTVMNNMLIVFGITAFMQIFAMAVAGFILKKICADKAKAQAYTFASSFGNIGFMGLPVVRLLLPNNPELVIYLAMMFVAFNLMAWTIGIYIMTGEEKYISFKKAIINPPTIAFCIAFPLFLFGVQIPAKIMYPIDSLAAMIIPLSMLIVGMRFGEVRPKELFGDKELYVSSLIKLIITPIVTLILASFIPIDDTLRAFIVILMAMPSATMGLIVAEQFGGDKEASVKAVLGSTLLSIITIPLVLLLV